MKYTVLLEDTANGQRKECAPGVDFGEGTIFWWTEGNMSCDCNRMESFYPWVDDAECGDERFRLLRITLEDGTVVYEGGKP